MSIPFSLHAEFEEAVYQAFPLRPLPRLDGWIPQTWLERNAKSLFAEKTWPEVIGLRMIRNELDAGLINWLGCIPAHIVDYYVPCHLMLGSLLLSYEAGRNYVDNLLEAFLLPPPGIDEGTAQNIDMELSLEAGIMDYAERRVGLYERLTPDQRAVIGRYLDLHLMHVGDWYDEPGRALLKQNRDYWLESVWRREPGLLG
jgi:hypothetical protein